MQKNGTWCIESGAKQTKSKFKSIKFPMEYNLLLQHFFLDSSRHSLSYVNKHVIDYQRIR